jgi:hypothetical protein
MKTSIRRSPGPWMNPAEPGFQGRSSFQGRDLHVGSRGICWEYHDYHGIFQSGNLRSSGDDSPNDVAGFWSSTLIATFHVTLASDFSSVQLVFKFLASLSFAWLT